METTTPDTVTTTVRLAALLEPYYAHVATRYTKQTCRSSMCDLRRFCRWAGRGAPVATLNPKTISRFLDSLGDDTKPCYNRIRGSVHRFCVWAVAAGYLARDPLETLTRPRTAVTATPHPPPTTREYTAYIARLNAIHDLPTAIDGFLAHRQWKESAPGTIANYRRWLERWHAWRGTAAHSNDLAAIGAADMVGFLEYLQYTHHAHQDNPHRDTRPTPGLAIESRQSCWRTLRTFWNFLADEELLTKDQTRMFKRGLVPRPRNDDPTGITHDRAVDTAMVMKLLAACGVPFDELTARNRAIIWMLHETGLRVAELCRLDHAHIDQTQMTGRVRGKGGKWGHVFWGHRTAAALNRYLAVRSGPADGTLFRSCGSRSAGHPITSTMVRQMMWALADKAGVALPPGAPIHGFRTGFAQEMLDAGVDSLDLKQLMRHERLDTTLIYVARHPAKLRRVYQRAAYARHMKPGSTA